MRLKKIIENLPIVSIKNLKNYNIKSITHISRDVAKNSIFICIKGSEYNGNDYIDEAIQNGAKVIITEEEVCSPNITIIVVKNIRKAMSIVAKNFYNKICDTMQIIGVIGTSGKTTTSFIIKQLLCSTGNKIGIIGTNGIYIDNIRLENDFTTPDPLEMHYIFYQMKMLGVETVVMEVSAQAISQYKMYGIRLKIGVFTNISNEHLDFFGTMENYAKCKMDYFNIRNMDEAVINVDDFYGRELAFKTNMPVVSYAIDSPANVFAMNIESSLNGIEFVVNCLDDIYKINTKLVGKYNVYNILAGMTVSKMLGCKKSDIEYAVNNLQKIDGRFNLFSLPKNNSIIVDFAHTIDSIEKLLSFVRENVVGRVITLFGCVGYSNRDKRKQMMENVLRYSDYVIVTTDNRGETPYEDIVADMVDGVSPSKYISIEDRACAIHFGYGLLKENDALVVMGKGAENFQKIEKERIPYSDIDIVQQLIKKQGLV